MMLSGHNAAQKVTSSLLWSTTEIASDQEPGRVKALVSGLLSPKRFHAEETGSHFLQRNYHFQAPQMHGSEIQFHVHLSAFVTRQALC